MLVEVEATQATIIHGSGQNGGTVRRVRAFLSMSQEERFKVDVVEKIKKRH